MIADTNIPTRSLGNVIGSERPWDHPVFWENDLYTSEA